MLREPAVNSSVEPRTWRTVEEKDWLDELLSEVAEQERKFQEGGYDDVCIRGPVRPSRYGVTVGPLYRITGYDPEREKAREARIHSLKLLKGTVTVK